ncbi:MAG: cell division protein FtsL [Treponema sp.]|nr:cell division protein FtsL [Treponema sp.]
MKQKSSRVREILTVCLVAVAIPALLILNGVQARRYENLADEVTALEKKQEELIEANKKLVTDISLLSSTERIEKIAESELGMHKAETNDIVRVEMKGKDDR